ncbi:hypothetical protein RFI_02523 [Reticulomyxa filosa]|uniref:DUF2971 domain-containing protein n=1 Tax=Reticulomyxa filosa TaxID=46433 RepID=X6P8Y0_RETFI|nr:hypothetical protein RFI_02523 [Reticulomyxa filosa]|eukprot:ETO34568.1 hypothetical protein RFI_02523 [Reticulomyxa filosa]
MQKIITKTKTQSSKGDTLFHDLNRKNRKIMEKFMTNVIKPLNNKHNEDIDLPLCHYTSLENGFEILRTQNLRSTEFKDLGSTARDEIVEGYELTIKAIEEFKSKNSQKPFIEIFYNEFLCVAPNSSYLSHDIKNKSDGAKRKQNKFLQSSYFVFSYSTKIDDEYLWNEFGNNSEGICICFKKPEFISGEYCSKSYKDKIKPYLEEACRFINKLQNEDLLIIKGIVVALTAEFLGYIPGFLQYKNESEYRTIEYEFILNDKILLKDLSQRKVKVGGKDLLNNFNAFNENRIEKIILGE